MKPVLILYATREGMTRRIAQYLADAIRGKGVSAEDMNVSLAPPEFSFSFYSAVIVAASVHGGQHEHEMKEFVKRHIAELESVPSMFLSVSLSEAGAEDLNATEEKRSAAKRDVKAMIEKFLAETGWHPQQIQPVAGALMYTKYNFLLRFMMKSIARRWGVSTDTSRDHVFTDWAALDNLAEQVAKEPAVVKS